MLKILDYYCHQGHQREFFRTGHEFYLTGLDSLKPNWNTAHRPLGSNVILIDERAAHGLKFDIVIVRSPLNPKRYSRFIEKGAIPVAVSQNTTPFAVDSKVRHIVWNSSVAMNNSSGFYPKNIKHHYIVHGFDPNEFRPIDGIIKNGRVLSVSNVFKKRDHFLDYKKFDLVNQELGNICDVLGHGNNDINSSIGEASSFNELIRYHNLYNVYFNTTIRSAMPRSRAEAIMSGIPTCTTCNYDIGKYFTHNKDIVYANTKDEMIREIKKLLANPELAHKIGVMGRETSIKHFHIDDYLLKWNNVFTGL